MTSKSFKKCWDYLVNHKIYEEPLAVENGEIILSRSTFVENLYIQAVMVNPISRQIENDNSLNTKLEIWLETGPYLYPIDNLKVNCKTHDIDLDCGGETFELAIKELAVLVHDIYGDNEDNALYKVNKKYRNLKYIEHKTKMDDYLKRFNETDSQLRLETFEIKTLKK